MKPKLKCYTVRYIKISNPKCYLSDFPKTQTSPLTANNSEKCANGSKSIIRNNLGLCKHSEIYLI